MSAKRSRLNDDVDASGRYRSPQTVPSMGGDVSESVEPAQIPLISPNEWKDLPEVLFVKLQKEGPDEVSEALKSLGQMLEPTTNSNKCKNEASRLGATALVLVAMRKFQYHEDIQNYGCICLHFLAFLESNRNALMESGGMETVINALKIFPASRNVQEFGFATIVNLVSGLDVQGRQNAKHFVSSLNGIELAVDAIQMFPDDFLVQAKACGIFCRLALEMNEYRQPLKDAGALSAVAKAFENHPGVDDFAKCVFVTFMKQMAA